MRRQLFELACALRVPDLAVRGVSALTLAAPAYHAFGVVPCCWKRLTSHVADLSQFDDNTSSHEKKKAP